MTRPAFTPASALCPDAPIPPPPLRSGGCDGWPSLVVAGEGIASDEGAATGAVARTVGSPGAPGFGIDRVGNGPWYDPAGRACNPTVGSGARCDGIYRYPLTP